VDFSVRSGTVDRFVALAGSPARGRTLGERIAESFAGLRSVVAHTGGNVFVVDVTSGAGDVLHVDGFDKRDLEDYVAYYRFHDPMAHFMVETNRSIRTLSDAATPLEIARTEYSDLIRRVSVESVAGWSHALGRGRYVAVGIHRAPRMRDFSERERALLEMLVPLIATPAIERARPRGLLATLTPAERAVVACIVRGLPDRAIAAALGVGFATVRAHLQSAFAKLRVSNRTELLHAVVAGGRTQFDAGGAPPRLAALSPRELAVAELVARGLGDREVARALGIGFASVRTYLDRAFEKLGVSSRIELARLALEREATTRGRPAGRRGGRRPARGR